MTILLLLLMTVAGVLMIALSVNPKVVKIGTIVTAVGLSFLTYSLMASGIPSSLMHR